MTKKTPIKFKKGDKIKIIKGMRPYYRKGNIGKVAYVFDNDDYFVDFRKLNEKWYQDGRWFVLAKNMVKVNESL